MKYSIITTFIALIAICIGFIQTTLLAINKEPVNETAPADHNELILLSNNIERRAFLYIPEALKHKQKAKPAPLLIALHGYGSTAGKIITDMEWSKKAEQESFIVVYPQGSRAIANKAANVWNNPQSWNDGAGRFDSGKQNIDDVAFIKQLISNISQDYNIDSKRIFITGFSNGAAMTFRLGAELSDIITAIAPYAGADWNKNIILEVPLSVHYITGTADTLNPMNGGIPRVATSKSEKIRDNDKEKPPVGDSINKWITTLNCTKKAALDNSDNGVRTRTYNSNTSNKIVYITIENHGHVWPGSPSKQPKMIVGNTTNKLNATDVIWDFFKNVPIN